MNIEEMIQDFTRRYSNTFTLVRMPGEDQDNVFHVDSITRHDDLLAVIQLSSDEFGTIKLNYGTGHKFRFAYPDVATFQNGKDASFFRRKPERQYKRGLCEGNAQFMHVHQVFVVTNVICPFNWETVNNAYRGVKYSMRQALEMLGKKRFRSVALAKGFSLCQDMTGAGNYHLFFFEMPVATISPDGRVLDFMAGFENEIKEL